EAFGLALAGALLGVGLMYLTLWLAQPLILSHYGLFIPITAPGPWEWSLLGGILLAAVLMGSVPAWRAYRQSLIDGLSIRTRRRQHETGVIPDRGDTAAERQRAGRNAFGNRLARPSSSGAARPAVDARAGARPECAGRVLRGAAGCPGGPARAGGAGSGGTPWPPHPPARLHSAAGHHRGHGGRGVPAGALVRCLHPGAAAALQPDSARTQHQRHPAGCAVPAVLEIGR